MKKKKLLALFGITSTLFSLIGCNAKNPYEITIWVDGKLVDLTTRQVNKFIGDNPDFKQKYSYRIDTVGEDDAATQLITDVEAGADLYIFSQDQLYRLIAAGALSKLPTNTKDESKSIEKRIQTRNNETSVNAVTYKDETGESHCYAYPVTNDNGYFLYYDKDVLDEDDVKTFDGILDVCETNGRNFAVCMKDGFWYGAGFFLSRLISDGVVSKETICKSEWQINTEGTFISKDDTFYSDNGVIAVNAIAQIFCSPSWLDSHSTDTFDRSSQHPSAAVVSGTWDYEIAKEKLGDDLGVAPLPHFTYENKDYQLGSFTGCKLMGVKPQEDENKAYWCAKLADYLTDETCQLERFNEIHYGPSNKNAQQSEAVQKDRAMKAINEQNVFATPQGSYPSTWWKYGEQKIVNAVVLNGSQHVEKDKALEILKSYKDIIDEIAPDMKKEGK